jgi:hypothetical protein
MFFTQVTDTGAAGFEDPQPEQAEHPDQGEVVRVGGQPGGGDQGFERQMSQSKGGDSGGTSGRRT